MSRFGVRRSPWSVRVVIAATCAVTMAGDVQAQPRRCPAIAGGSPELAAQDAEARLAFIRSRMRHDAYRAGQWSLGFGTSYAIIAGTAFSLGAREKDRGKMADLYVGGSTAIVGVGLLVFAPLHVVHDSKVLEAQIAAAGANADTCRMLALAETMLVRDVKSEKFGRGWFTHTGNALLGIAALLVLGLGYKRWLQGGINGAASIAIGELMINLQPHGLVRDLAAYRKGDLRPPPKRRRFGRRR